MVGEQEFSRWIWAEKILREEICISAGEDGINTCEARS